MVMRVIVLTLFAATLAGMGCSGSNIDEKLIEGENPSETEGGLADAVGDTGPIEPGGPAPDTTVVDTDDGDTDGPVDCEEDPGAFGCPCEENKDCDDGYCVETLVGSVCTDDCIENCPEGWKCLPVGTGQSIDVTYVCVPTVPELCAPCSANSDCGYDDDLCVAVNGADSGYCAADCVSSADCPQGYSCKGATGVDGTSAAQCVPTSGACDCTPALDGTVKSCTADNQFGSCTGFRTCDAESGWSACTAVEPAPEVCDGIDNDCDGELDEEFLSTSCDLTNEFGTCKGDTECRGSQGVKCQGIEPSAELCDGLDNDCNGLVDETQADFDNDGLADCVDDDRDGDGDPNDTDCEDLNPEIYTGAPEECDGIDSNCDGVADDGFSDFDGDGLADCVDNDDDGDEVGDVVDCGPLDPNQYPGADEVCDGKDNDCDGDTDEGPADGCVPFAVDADNDGFGGLTTQCACAVGPGLATNADDCNDANESIYPGADEVCNGIDDDCDGETDEDGQALCTDYYLDLDGDGWGTGEATQCTCGPQGDWKATKTGDCNDSNSEVYPGAAEACNGVDDNCSGEADEGQGGEGCTVYFEDLDGDAFGVSGEALCLCAPVGDHDTTQSGDCDDADATIYPGAAEICDGIDQNCSGAADEGCDDDNDGYCDADLEQGDDSPCENGTGDCDDQNNTIYPSASESCNGIDDDCDGQTDEGAEGGCVEYYFDGDGDGWGTGTETVCTCGPDGDWSATQTGDCDDDNGSVNPGAAEPCNGVDDDCSGVADDGAGGAGCTVYFFDGDDDGVGVATQPACLCEPTGDFDTTVPGDCNDGNGGIYPGATEICDGIDQNCSGGADEGCDDDNDGYCDADLVLGATPPCPSGGGDCDDSNNTVAPGKPEVCNGVDDDCDGATDEGAEGGCTTYYLDVDGDGVGAGSESQCTCGPEGDWDALVTGDCAPNNPDVFPGAAEVCNGVDDNCDGETDEGSNNAGCTIYFADADNDEFGVAGQALCLCAPDGVHTATNAGDCNDDNETVFPGATEICDGVDQNCSGAADEGCDDDADGYCQVGYVLGEDPPCVNGGGDCNDSSNTVYPGAPEVCNGLDDDCDGTTDEGAETGCTEYYLDNDEDGFGTGNATQCTCGPEGDWTALVNGDCAGNNPNIHPGAAEVCNGFDDDCDGQTDEGTGNDGCTNYFLDADGDGVGLSSSPLCLCEPLGDHDTQVPGDCDDADAAVFPGAAEICDGIDQNCSGAADEGCDDDEDGFCDADLVLGATPPCPSGGGDCNDTNDTVFPGKIEICNGIDDDCDGNTDEDAEQGCTEYYFDGDNDGVGAGNETQCTCGPQGQWKALVNGDCNDSNPNIKPGALEVCNDVDDDCDGETDEGSGLQGCQVFFIDTDGDDYGVSADALCLCEGSGDYTATLPGDCNDDEASINPGAAEICDGVDQNCAGGADEGCDDDEDGYCDANLALGAFPPCANGGGDCDDGEDAVNPGASEVCNGEDDNCDGVIDEGVQSPCGGCAAFCQFKVGVDTDTPFDEDVAVGMVKLPGGSLQLDASEVQFNTIWVANSAEDTMSKIDTNTGNELARYRVCDDPSRTAVDPAGDVYVGCRKDGKVVKVFLDPNDCVDKNGNGVIDTSADFNGDGQIFGAELMDWGVDECIAFTVEPAQIDAVSGNEAEDTIRAVAVDADGYAWVGGWDSRFAWKLSPFDGSVVQAVDLSNEGNARPYGFALDQLNRLWISMRNGAPSGLGMVDLGAAVQELEYFPTPGAHQTYGVTIDIYGKVWVAGGEQQLVSIFDPTTEAWSTVNMADWPNTRGMAASSDGKVYVAHHTWGGDCADDHFISVFDAATGLLEDMIDYGGDNPARGPVGLSLDFEGNLWAINQCESTASKINRTTHEEIGTYATGNNPYTYSDMAGYALKTVVAPEGIYEHVFEGWQGEGQVTNWNQIAVVAETPLNTDYTVEVRTAASTSGLASTPWQVYGPFPPSVMPLDISSLGIQGRYMELRVAFTGDNESTPPTLIRIEVLATRQ